MELQLTKFKVEIKDEMNWGDTEQIQAEVMGAVELTPEMIRKIRAAAAAADNAGIPMGKDVVDPGTIKMDAKVMLAAKVKATELLVTKITDESGAVIPFSKDWLFNLSRADGNKLSLEIDRIRNKTESALELETEIEKK